MKVRQIEEYCRFIEEMLNNSEKYGIYGYDEAGERTEIRLILPKHNRMLLCSAEQGGGSLKCFSGVKKKYDEIKGKEQAIKLAYSFRVDSKASKNCDSADELREFLKSKHEKKGLII
ncbi:hypothetical protein NHP164001_08840 [Helicobacter trogontum]|uniref:Uncharacterized protein n=2 Tax=Helicobacter trogontum TaxID=50960 RepID=A0ABQ0D3F0_9HELI